MIYQNEPGKPEKKLRSKVKKSKEERVAERVAERRKQKGKDPTSSKKAEEVKQPAKSHGTELNGMKQPVTIAADGHTITAKIPAGVAAYRFMLIDNNGFLQYSEVQTSK